MSSPILTTHDVMTREQPLALQGRDRPILFSAPMVIAQLREVEAPGTGKTQTRRILKPQPTECQVHHFDCTGTVVKNGYSAWEAHGTSGPVHAFKDGADCVTPCIDVPYAIGDRLWVRENWYAAHGADDVKPRDMDKSWKVCPAVDWNYADWGIKGRLRPGIHMPRWASRLTLTVTDVRVQRLQEISEADCIAEGPPNVSDYHISGPAAGLSGLMVRDPAQPHIMMTPRTWYRELWDTINGAGAWDRHPWIVAVTFTVRKGNIDQ